MAFVSGVVVLLVSYFNLLLVWSVEGVSVGVVTCGSLVKLVNEQHRVRLHSHDVKYGSGSGQQSVTAVEDVDDSNSYWQLLHPYYNNNNQQPCTRGAPIQCGDVVRLQHVNTGKFLHSHLFAAPLTETLQEVSAFGSSSSSDTGDNWQVVCSSDVWRRDDDVKLKHVDTGSFLSTTGTVYGRPIRGQFEVVASPKETSRSCRWKTSEGAFLKQSEDPNRHHVQQQEEHDEL